MPDTTNYMLLGYAVVVTILIGSVVYLVLKARSLRNELHMLETLEAEDKAPGQQSTREPAKEPLATRDTRSGDVPL